MAIDTKTIMKELNAMSTLILKDNDKINSSIELIDKYKNNSQINNCEYVGTIYFNIGNIYFDQKRYDESFEYYNNALPILINHIGNDHVHIGKIYKNLGNIYFTQKKGIESLECYYKALPILINWNNEDMDIGIIYNNIAYMYLINMKYDESLEFYNKALPILINLNGDKHNDIGIIYKNIALIYKKTAFIYKNKHKYINAIEYIDKALDIFDENHTSNLIQTTIEEKKEITNQYEFCLWYDNYYKEILNTKMKQFKKILFTKNEEIQKLQQQLLNSEKQNFKEDTNKRGFHNHSPIINSSKKMKIIQPISVNNNAIYDCNVCFCKNGAHFAWCNNQQYFYKQPL